MMKYLSILFLFLVFGFFSCREAKKADVVAGAKSNEFSISSFDALTDFKNSSDSIRTIEMDYFDAVNTGFIIPTARQVTEGYFKCSFRIKNNSGKAKKFFYKIYYQNESYKFPEADSAGNQNGYALENFYGSWPDSNVLFRQTPEILADGNDHEITDSIRIIGNPRNEAECYSNGVNERWKRNPRVGNYSFLLVVTAEDNVTTNKIPPYIKNIGLKNGDAFVNPYYYFLSGDGKKLSNTETKYSNTSLKVIARPDVSAGIYIDGYFFPDVDVEKYESDNCDAGPTFYKTSAFSQFIHYIDVSTKLENIPVIADVLGDNYSKRDYNWNRSFYRKEELISGTPMIAKIPCKTVYSDPANKKIVLRNPATTEGKWKKENVGIISRHGLCYGKIRVKAKLTELLNKNGVWNGITNAIWLINQPGAGDWNLRRSCRKEGYMSTYWGGKEDKRVDRVGYSEIDFEILKTPAYCPDQTFPPVYKNPTNDPRNIDSWNTPLPQEIVNDDGNITVACTNWDMACWEPKNFGVGCNPVKYGDKIFDAFRWDHWYRAVTEKTPASDDLLFGSDYFYFEIEWKPKEIIWRIGPEKDQMKVVGYMNDEITSIPNNQMLLIVTQEFHNTKWWPGSPFQQNNIPFPKKDIVGEIYEVTVE